MFTTGGDRKTGTMATYYRLAIPEDQGIVSSNAIESIRAFLERQADWPPGPYEILEGPSISSFFDGPNRRWGVALRHPDGTVDLVPDRPELPAID